MNNYNYENNNMLSTILIEMKMLSDKLGVDWDVAVNGFSLDLYLEIHT